MPPKAVPPKAVPSKAAPIAVETVADVIDDPLPEKEEVVYNSTALYAFGGVNCTSNVTYLSSLELCDVRGGEWKALPGNPDLVEEVKGKRKPAPPPVEMTLRRCEFASVALGRCIYIFGGRLGNDYLDSGEVYDLEGQEWKPLPPMKRKRRGLAAVVWENAIYAIGGRSESTMYLSSVERFDPEAQSWTSLPRMETKRTAHSAAALDGALYVMGGHDGTASLSSGERFDIVNNTWAALPAMENRRIHAAAVALTLQRGAIYVFGGSSLCSVERFFPDPKAKDDDPLGFWETLPPMDTVRCRHVAIPSPINESIYLLGGYDGTNYLSSVARFQVHSKTWFASGPKGPLSKGVPDMTAIRCDFGGVALEHVSMLSRPDTATEPTEEGDPSAESAAVARAEAALAEATESGDVAAIGEAEKALAEAQAALQKALIIEGVAQAQATLAAATESGDAAAIDEAEKALAKAQAAADGVAGVARAQAALAAATESGDAAAIGEAEKALAEAQDRVDGVSRAEAALAAATESGDAAAIDEAEAALIDAQAALAEAQAAAKERGEVDAVAAEQSETVATSEPTEAAAGA